jgi:hypothetical protein
MPKASPILLSFNSGELSPQLRGRIDFEKYRSGCAKLENFIPQIQGPARKRPGTRFVNEVKDSTKFTRLIPFEFSLEQAYILEFGNQYMRLYADGGLVLSPDPGNPPYEIATPYLAEDLPSLEFVQSSDVVYIAHPDYPPQKLQRFSPTNWVIEPIDFDWPPFDDQNTTATTVTASAVTGTGITLTASTGIFANTDIGAFFRIEEVNASKFDLWEPGKSISSGAVRRYEQNVYQATSTGTTGGRPPIHTEGTESDGVVNWLFLHDGQGYAEITGFTSSTVVTADVIKRFPTSSATKRWSFSEWSPTRGYPRTVTFYEDRLWWAGTRRKPQTLWASVTGDYENHKYGTKDDDALNYTINSQDSNTILWILSGKVLAIGTSNGEFTLSATQISDPVTPTNVRITPQTNYGSERDVRPLSVGNSILFLQRAGKKVREYSYQFDTDSYVAVNMNTLADHITGPGLVDLSFQQEPSQIMWAVCSCGTLVGLTYERSEEVVGWHRHNLGGLIESLATIPHWDRDQDVTFMVIKRTVGGQTKRYVEYIEKYRTGTDAHFVDSGLSYDGVPTSTLSGLDHLEGEEVDVLIDGAVHPRVTVTSGQVQLQYEGSVIHVGLPYVATLTTMPIEAGAADGVAQGKTQRINNLTVRLLETGPGLFYGPFENRLDELHPRTTINLMDNAIPVFTGDTRTLAWPGENQTAPQITIQHKLPTPCTVIALMPQLVTYDR